MSLESLIRAARTQEPQWDDARAERTRVATLALRTQRTARAKAVRRSIVAVSSVAVVILVLLRGAVASTSDASDVASAHESQAAMDELIAASIAGDGGYRRD